MSTEQDPKRHPDILLGFTPAEKLQFFLTGYSDEIPQNMLHSTSPDKYYKCRKGWFQGITSVFEVLIANGDLRESVRESAQGFVNNICSDEFRAKARIGQSDIDYANETIKKVLNTLK